MKKTFIMLVGVLTVFCTGCYSTITGYTLYEPEVLTVAHLTNIKNDTVYSSGGTFYIQTNIVRYERDTNLFRNIFVKYQKYHPELSNKNITHRWIEISPELKDYLCTKPVDEKKNVLIRNVVNGKLQFVNKEVTIKRPAFRFKENTCIGKLAEKSPDITTSKQHKVELPVELRKNNNTINLFELQLPAEIMPTVGVDGITEKNNIPKPYITLQEESQCRYYLIPLTLLTVPADIVMTVLLHLPFFNSLTLL